MRIITLNGTIPFQPEFQQHTVITYFVLAVTIMIETLFLKWFSEKQKIQGWVDWLIVMGAAVNLGTFVMGLIIWTFLYGNGLL